MNRLLFLDGAQEQWIVHWLGLPYLVESSHNRYFYNVLTIDEQSIDFELEYKILDKFFKMKLNAKRSEIEPNGARNKGRFLGICLKMDFDFSVRLMLAGMIDKQKYK